MAHPLAVLAASESIVRSASTAVRRDKSTDPKADSERAAGAGRWWSRRSDRRLARTPATT
jgi:hypothetical protein